MKDEARQINRFLAHSSIYFQQRKSKLGALFIYYCKLIQHTLYIGGGHRRNLSRCTSLDQGQLAVRCIFRCFGRRYFVGLDVELRIGVGKQTLLLAIFIAEDNVVKLRLEMLQYVLLEMSGGPLQRSDVLYF